MKKKKTMRDALEFINNCLESEDKTLILMAKIMIGNIIKNLEIGKTINDKVDFDI